MASEGARSADSARVFGRYRLGKLLAQGGMAEVYRAEQVLGGAVTKPVVIKKIKKAVAHDESFVAMFEQEAAIAAGLSHGNIAQVFDFGEVAGEYFLAIELVDGVDAADFMDRAQERRIRLPPEYACYVVMEMCKGLHYAHTRTDAYGKPLGIVHRDVSPQNVLIAYDGQVKLVDFGVAKAYGAEDRPGRVRTATGVVKGKYSYFSPEQARARPLDAQSDVYAAGVVLYELLCGRLPFEGEMFQMLARLMHGEFPLPSSLNAAVDAPLERIVLRAMALEKSDRYASALELQQALSAHLAARAPRFTQASLAEAVCYLFRGERKERGLPQAFSDAAAKQLEELRADVGTPASRAALTKPIRNVTTDGTRFMPPPAELVPTDSGAGRAVHSQRVKVDLELAALAVVAGPLRGVRASLERDKLVIGRDDGCDVLLEHRSISRRHCELTRQADGNWRVRDLGSANGVELRGDARAESVLRPGDRLVLGHMTLQLLGRGEFLPEPAEDAPAPRRRLSPMAIGGLLGAAGLAIAAAVVIGTGEPPTPPVVGPPPPVRLAPPKTPARAEPVAAPPPVAAQPLPEAKVPPEPRKPAPPPSPAELARDRAETLLADGKSDDALPFLATSLKLEPHDAETSRKFAAVTEYAVEARLRDHDDQGALPLLERAHAVVPDDPKIVRHLYEVHRRLGHSALADKYLREIMKQSSAATPMLPKLPKVPASPVRH